MSDTDSDSAVCRVEIEHEDGSVRVLEGEDARDWVEWVNGSVGLAVTRGQSPPDVDWKRQPENTEESGAEDKDE